MLKSTKIKEIRMAFVYEMIETIKGIKIKEIADRLGISDKTVYKYREEFIDRQNMGQPAVKYDVTGYKVPTTAEEALAIYNEIEELEQVTQKSEEEMDKFFAEEQQKEAEKVEPEVEEKPTVETEVEEQIKPKVEPKPKQKTKPKNKTINKQYTSTVRSSSPTKKCGLFNGFVKVVKAIFKKGDKIGII